MKKIRDLTPYTTILPYASEIFGVYQPMIGWRSNRMRRRMEKGFDADQAVLREELLGHIRADLDALPERGASRKGTVRLGLPASTGRGSMQSVLMDTIGSRLPAEEDYDPAIWDELLAPEALQRTLDEVVAKGLTVKLGGARAQRDAKGVARKATVADQIEFESKVGGFLSVLKEGGLTDELKKVFYKDNRYLSSLIGLLKFRDPLDFIDPKGDIDRATLSPLGIVHLFRQYFFELDTFLGTPVSHVWLSPGSMVELVEVSTRKTLTERVLESSFESVTKSEQSLTEEDELTDAVKQSNRSETKFGMNGSVNQGWIGGSASASTSIDMSRTQDQAREVAHRHMRQQTETLATEIRKNYKSTFRTVTEVTDTSSKRYVLNNTTDELVNYELRRKMRQVAVQVHDIGTYLAWQTYVDDPGRQLGIAKLVHLAKSPEVGSVPPPESIPDPQPTMKELSITIPYEQISEDRGDLDEAYRNGWEVDTDFNEGDRERIRSTFGPFDVVCDQPGFEMAKDGPEFDIQGNDVRISVRELEQPVPGKVSFKIHLDYVNFRGTSPMVVLARVHFSPTEDTLTKIRVENEAKTATFNRASQLEYEKAFVTAARERIEAAADVKQRQFEDLREEERIVVYRALIQDMLMNGLKLPDDRTRHVVAELLNTIFDIDKMLYFVAPEWWRPRLHGSHQNLGDLVRDGEVAGGGQIASAHEVGWGGVDDPQRDNYYITEDSQPAKLGSSLGWLLQLDGDNLRNAFLNAPWVKAVIPVRPGKERAAMSWLQGVGVEGTEGLDDLYSAPADELATIPHSGPDVTIRDAINHLADTVRAKHEVSMDVGRFPKQEIDDDNKVSATPIDKVYEHGFYPLQGGFRASSDDHDAFDVFDQWVEIVPTDQVVPVPVAYDPKTGRQV